MKIYAIADKNHKCYGHGEFAIENVIREYDGYHKQGRWHPVFKNYKDAKEYLIKYKCGTHIVELELR